MVILKLPEQLTDCAPLITALDALKLPAIANGPLPEKLTVLNVSALAKVVIVCVAPVRFKMEEPSSTLIPVKSRAPEQAILPEPSNNRSGVPEIASA